MTADKQAFSSVALLCVMDYKAVIHSHLLLNDTPYRAAVLSGECSPLIKQQEVLFRFCRLFLINSPFYGGQTPPLAYRSSKSSSKSFHPRIYNYELSHFFFNGAFNCSLGFFFSSNIALVVKFFTFTKTNLNLCSAFFKVD